MATEKNRKICNSCRKKIVVDKMTFNMFWFCNDCFLKLDVLGTETKGCPSELLEKIKKCPYYQIANKLYTSPFWLEIRKDCLCTFDLIDYSDESEHLIPAKVDSRFDDDFLG